MVRLHSRSLGNVEYPCIIITLIHSAIIRSDPIYKENNHLLYLKTFNSVQINKQGLTCLNLILRL